VGAKVRSIANKKCYILAFNNVVCVQTTDEQKEMSTALRKHTHKHIYCSVLVTRDLKVI